MADARRAIEACAEFTRGGGPPAPDHDTDHAARSIRVNAEEGRLAAWAKANGRLGRRLPPEFGRGGEHSVYLHKRSKRYLKSTLPERHRGFGIALSSYIHGATPSEYLDRLGLQNAIFDDDIRLERVVLQESKPIIVISQPAIEGEPSKPEAIDAMMEAKGYERLAEGAYYDELAGLLIFDLAPRNALTSANGVIYPIDPVMQRITREFGDFLREHPYTINLPR